MIGTLSQELDTCDHDLWNTPLGKAIDAFVQNEVDTADGFANGSRVKIYRSSEAEHVKEIFKQLDLVQPVRLDNVIIHVNW